MSRSVDRLREGNSMANAYGATPAYAGGGEPLALTWRQQSGLIGLSIINFILRVLTLGIHHFWGKTEVRRRIWSSVRLNGEPLEYTGTGGELFIGFLVAVVVLVVPVLVGTFAIVFLFGPDSIAQGVFIGIYYVAIFFLLGFALHRALRYRLSRTRWRGIRGGLEGSSMGYAWTSFWTALLIPFTLGWIMPWRQVKLQGILSNGMRFGSRPFRFSATSGPLYGRFAAIWFLSLVLFLGVGAVVGVAQYFALGAQSSTLAGPPEAFTALGIAALVVIYLIFGVLVAWYQAGAINHFAAHTAYEGAQFRANATTWSLIWLVISNMLIVTFTLGLLTPVAQARSARYMVERLSINGAVPLAEIAQRAKDPMRRGEGLAQVFDVDAF
jgi:uncharacterized membrane protein YjgN (DUF898 family)